MANLFEMNTEEEGIFHHPCGEEECSVVVIYDDEPFCYKHSPDSGSSVRGYSAREEALGSIVETTTIVITVTLENVDSNDKRVLMRNFHQLIRMAVDDRDGVEGHVEVLERG